MFCECTFCVKIIKESCSVFADKSYTAEQEGDTVVNTIRNMKWLVVSVVIYLQVAYSQQSSPIPTGSCASINYANKCCPPSVNRIGGIATDGGSHPCACDTLCHTFQDCCTADANCTRGISSASV